jgi:hypothetical protein
VYVLAIQRPNLIKIKKRKELIVDKSEIITNARISQKKKCKYLAALGQDKSDKNFI